MKVMGRVSKSSVLTGSAEFTALANLGDFMYYLDADNEKIVCQITSLQQTPYQGFTGYFRILGKVIKPPQVYSQLFLYEETETGVINIGVDLRKQPVKLRLNPFFRHVLLAGKTQAGKSHLAILLAEEFLKLQVPHILIDTQGEFVNLKGAVVVEDIRVEDLIGYMQQRKTVIVNLLGLSYTSKAHVIYDCLSELRNKKEEDYKQAEGDMDLLKIPPLLITLDEAEKFAVSNYAKVLDAKTKEILIDIAKRGSKFGMGLIAIAQRPPYLDIDVRSQCNSAIIFRLDDKGSLQVISQLGYISRYDIKRIKRFSQGECLITGDLTKKPTIVRTNDITTKRAKNVDFAEILGVQETFKIELEPDPNLKVRSDLELGVEEENNLVDAQRFINDHSPSQSKTRHYGRPGSLGSTLQQQKELSKVLKLKRR